MSSNDRYPTLHNWRDIDFSKVVVKEARRNQNGGLTVDIEYRDDTKQCNEKLWVQGPRMRLPFGITSSAMFSDRKPDAVPNMSLDMALSGLRAGDAEMIAFEQFCSAWDNLIIGAATQNSTHWFGREKSESTVKELIKPLIKEPRDPKYDPTARVKLPRSYGKYAFRVFDQNKNTVDADESLVAGNEVIPIFEIRNIWFVGNQFGTSLDAKQIQCFVKDELSDFIVMDGPPMSM